MVTNNEPVMITHVWDGYFCYELLTDSGDDWLTVRLAGHVLQIRKSDVIFPVPEGCADLFEPATRRLLWWLRNDCTR